MSVQRVCVVLEWMRGEEEERLKMMLRVGEREAVPFEVVGRKGECGIVVGSDERGVEGLEVVWKAGQEVQDWVFEVDGVGREKGRVAGTVRGLWVVLGYSLKL